MDIELDLLYCCVCLNTESLDDRDFIQFNCCYQYIHKYCFIMWICNPKYNDIAVSLSCPLCRANIEDINYLVSEDELRREMEQTTYYREDYIARIINKYYRGAEVDTVHAVQLETYANRAIQRTQKCMIILCLLSFFMLAILMVITKLIEVKNGME